MPSNPLICITCTYNGLNMSYVCCTHGGGPCHTNIQDWHRTRPVADFLPPSLRPSPPELDINFSKVKEMVCACWLQPTAAHLHRPSSLCQVACRQLGGTMGGSIITAAADARGAVGRSFTILSPITTHLGCSMAGLSI